MKIFVETERLLLREIIESDEDALFELDSNALVSRYLGNKPVQSKEQIRAIIAMIRKQYVDNGIGRWAIIERRSNDFLGWTGLKLVTESMNNHINFYDLGYRLMPKYWGSGYATESAIGSVNFGFNQLNLNEIFGMCDSENVASRKVLEKSGLKFIETFDVDGVRHDWLKIERENWEKSVT